MGIFDGHRPLGPDGPEYFPMLWKGKILMMPMPQSDRPEAPRTSSIFYDPKTLQRLGNDALQDSQIELILDQFTAMPDDNPQELF